MKIRNAIYIEFPVELCISVVERMHRVTGFESQMTNEDMRDFFPVYPCMGRNKVTRPETHKS